MRILLILPEPPIPFGGAAARWFHVLLKELSSRGIAAKVLVCSGGQERDREATALHGGSHALSFFAASNRTRIGAMLHWFRPFSYPYSSLMRRELYSLPLSDFDIIHFETQFAGWLIDRKIPNARVNVHSLYSIDLQGSGASSFRDHVLRRLVIRAEKQLLKRFGHISTLTDRLSQAAKEINQTAQITTIPMALDMSQYPYPEPLVASSRRVPTIGLIGSFNWTPTFLAGRVLVERIWPEFQRRVPNGKLLLVGRHANSVFADVANESDIRVHSDVKDPLPFFRDMDLMVYLPTVGSGMKVKVLESIAMGTPIITNSEGVEGLPLAIANCIAVGSIEEAIEKAVVLSRDLPTIAHLRALRDQLSCDLHVSKSVDMMLHGLLDDRSMQSRSPFQI